MQYLTAWGALVEIAGIDQSDSVVITAASSSVGLAAIEIVKAGGATAIATTRRSDKKQFLLDAGADSVIVTEEENLEKGVMEATSGQGARVIFDPVAGPMLEQLCEAAAFGGTIFVYGALAKELTPLPLFSTLSKGLSVRGYTLFEIVKDPITFARGKEFVRQGLEAGIFCPVIDRVFPLDEIVDAHRYMESNQQKGKIVVSL